MYRHALGHSNQQFDARCQCFAGCVGNPARWHKLNRRYGTGGVDSASAGRVDVDLVVGSGGSTGRYTGHNPCAMSFHHCDVVSRRAAGRALNNNRRIGSE